MSRMSNAVWRTTDETKMRRKVGHQAILIPTAKQSTVPGMLLGSNSSSLAKQAEEATTNKANRSNRRPRVKEDSEVIKEIRTSRLQTTGRRAAREEAMATSLITMIDRRLPISSSIQRPAASTHLEQKEEASRVVNKAELKANSKGAKETIKALAIKVNKVEAVKEVVNGVAIKINKVLSQAARLVIKEGLKEASNSLTG